MTHAAQPASTICRNMRCTSGASGVVRDAGSSWSPTEYVTVPRRPHFLPAASKTARNKYAVVVLPFVPVMPTTCIERLGCP